MRPVPPVASCHGARRCLTVSPDVRLLDRYLFRELLLPLIYCIGGFVICILIFDVFDMLGEFQRNHLTAIDVVDYYRYRLPELVVTYYLIPMSLLLGLLYALTNHARHHELTAMRAAGLSLGRISVPYFVVAVLLGGGFYALNEWVVPDSGESAELVLSRHVATGRKTAAEKAWKRNVLFVNQQDGRTWQISAYNTQSRVMYKPQIESHLPDGTRLHLFAERGLWVKRRWLLTNVEQFVYPPGTDFPVKSILAETNLPRILETPRLIASEIKISGLDSLHALRRVQLSSGAILDFLRLHPTLDERRKTSLLVMLHSRLAAPWTCLVVVLIAIPFGAVSGRRNVFVGVASSITICLIYFGAKDLSLVLGSGGRVPAWVAGWGPNAIFAAAGLVLMRRLR